VVALAALGLALAVLLLVVKVGPEQLANTKGLKRSAQGAEVGRVRTAILAVLAGGIAAVGAVYSARTFNLSRRGQITDRFLRAVDQLGNTAVYVRTGGVFALEQIALESRVEHRAVMEVLAAFVREGSPNRPPPAGRPMPRVPADVSAALLVLTRRDRRFDRPDTVLDLSDTNLSFLQLPAGTDLRGVDLTGTSLHGARLPGADLRAVDLQGADLVLAHLPRARLAGAVLFAATLDHADLGSADLREAYLAGTTLHGTVLIAADLRGAHLDTYFGPDRKNIAVDYRPADVGGWDGNARAMIDGAIYDDDTRWPTMPPAADFDPDAWGAERS
jgi:hypothetical protein